MFTVWSITLQSVLLFSDWHLFETVIHDYLTNEGLDYRAIKFKEKRIFLYYTHQCMDHSKYMDLEAVLKNNNINWRQYFQIFVSIYLEVIQVLEL